MQAFHSPLASDLYSYVCVRACVRVAVVVTVARSREVENTRKQGGRLANRRKQQIVGDRGMHKKKVQLHRMDWRLVGCCRDGGEGALATTPALLYHITREV